MIVDAWIVYCLNMSYSNNPMCFFDEICILISQKNTEGVLYLEYNEGFDKLLMTI